MARSLNNDPALVPESAYPLLHSPPSEEARDKIRASRSSEDDFVMYDLDQAARIADVTKAACGLELTAEVVLAEANVAKLARIVVDAAKLLRPFERDDSSLPGRHR